MDGSESAAARWPTTSGHVSDDEAASGNDADEDAPPSIRALSSTHQCQCIAKLMRRISKLRRRELHYDVTDGATANTDSFAILTPVRHTCSSVQYSSIVRMAGGSARVDAHLYRVLYGGRTLHLGEVHRTQR